MRSIADLTDVAPDAQFHPGEPVEVHGAVLVPFRLRGRGRYTGIEFERTDWWLHTIRDGRIIRLEGFTDENAARSAAAGEA
jgi:ketosteroid isomerase-like protein